MKGSNRPSFDPDNTDAQINAALDTDLPNIQALNLSQTFPTPLEGPLSPVPESPDGETNSQPLRRTLSEFKISKSFDTSPPPLETRPRAEEINSGAKLLPKIEAQMEDFFGFEIEVEKWFGTCMENIPQWFAQIREGSAVEQKVYEILVCKCTKASELGEIIKARCLEAIRDGWLQKIDINDRSFSNQTLLYLLLTAKVSNRKESGALLSDGVGIVTHLMNHIASLRWSISDEDNEYKILRTSLFRILRMSLMATFGDTLQDLKRAKRKVWSDVYGLKFTKDENFASLSPLSYVEFIENLQHKYPIFIPECNETHGLGLYLKFVAQSLNSSPESEQPTDPQDLVNENQVVVPFTPTSIIEANELYKRQTEPSPQTHQLKSQLNTNSSTSDGQEAVYKSHPILKAIHELYAATYKIQKSFASVAIDSILHSCKKKSVFGIHAVGSTIYLLLSWFDLGHILMREHFAALLFDCQFHFTAHIFCETFQDILSCILEPYSCSEIWSLAGGEGIVQDIIMGDRSQDRTQLVIDDFNHYHLQMYINLLRISRFIMDEKTKRILVVAALPFDPWKQLFTFYQKDLWVELLSFIKIQVPFMGKRWRCMNMELISAIYMYCPTKLDDNWLYGKDVTRTVNQAPQYEALIRKLIHKYNEQFRDS